MPTKRTQQKNPPNTNIADLPQRQGEEYRSTYTHYVEVGASPWDFRLLFFEIVEDEAGQFVREKKARVVMSPQHAIAFTELLKAHIEKWRQEIPDAIGLLKIKEISEKE